MNNQEIFELLKGFHRDRRYAMKVQQKLDGAMVSYVRLNKTDWVKAESEEDRNMLIRLTHTVAKTH